MPELRIDHIYKQSLISITAAAACTPFFIIQVNVPISSFFQGVRLRQGVSANRAGLAVGRGVVTAPLGEVVVALAAKTIAAQLAILRVRIAGKDIGAAVRVRGRKSAEGAIGLVLSPIQNRIFEGMALAAGAITAQRAVLRVRIAGTGVAEGMRGINGIPAAAVLLVGRTGLDRVVEGMTYVVRIAA